MDEDFYLCWSDVTGAVRKRARFIGYFVLVCASLLFGYALLRTPLFFCQAVFQEKGKGSAIAGGTSSLMQLSSIVGSSGNNIHSTLSMMESRRLAEMVIAHMGLQIHEKLQGKTWRLLKNFKDNLLSEFAFWTERPSSTTAARSAKVVFRDVEYNGLYPCKFSLTFGKEGTFTVASPWEKITGSLGKKVNCKDFCFVAEALESVVAEGTQIDFVAEPLYKTLNQFKRSLHVKSGKRKDGTVVISYAHPSPTHAVEVTNALMYEYLQLIKADAQKVISEQMSFLAQTQEAAWNDLELKFNEHANFAEESIAKSGYVRTKEGIKMFSKAYSEAEAALRGLQNEEASLKGSNPMLIANSHPTLRSQLAEMNQKLHDLNARKNALQVALSQSDEEACLIQPQAEALQKEEQLRAAFGKLLSGVPIDRVRIKSPVFERALVPWGTRALCGNERELFYSYLNSLIRASKLRSRIFEAGMETLTLAEAEVQGLGLAPATQNYDRSLNQLRELEIYGVSLRQAIDHLGLNDFDVGALLDTLGLGENFRQIARECHVLRSQLKEAKNYSLKERSRMGEELEDKQSVLRDHLNHVWAMNKNQQLEARGRIRSAQKTLLNVVCRESALVEEEMRRAIEQRRLDLKKEMVVSQERLSNLKKQMGSLPKAWLREKKLDMQTEFQSELMGALISLVESRQLSASLDIVESKPLDTAQFPIRPKAPGLILWGIAGGALGLCLSLICVLGRAAISGFIATPDNLRVRGQFVAGALAHLSLASQDKVRRRALLFSEKQSITLVGAAEKELHGIIGSLNSQGYRVSVVAQDGVLKRVEGAELHLMARLDRPSIQQILEQLAGSFDKILVYCPDFASSLMGEHMARLNFDTLVYLNGERVRELYSYFELSKRSRVAFVF